MRRTVVLLLAFAVSLTTGVALIAVALALPDRQISLDQGTADKAVVERFYAAVNDALRTGSPPALDGVVAPELIRSEGRPDGDESRPDFQQTLDRLAIAFAGLRIAIEDLVAERGQIVALTAVEGGRRDVLPGVPIHGPTAIWRAVDRFRVVDDRIVAFDHWEQGLDAAVAEPLFESPLARFPATPAAIEVNRVVLPPGAHLPGLIGPGPELLMLEAGTLTVDLAGSASRHGSTSGPATVEGRVALQPGDLLVVPTGTPFTIANGGQSPAVIFSVALFPTAERGPENEGIDASALGAAVLAGTASAQRLAAGLVVDPAIGGATVSATRLTLAPGAGLGEHRVAGVDLLAVEAGSLGLTAPGGSRPDGGERGGERWLVAGEGAVLSDGNEYAIRNTGADPLRLLVVRIVPAETDSP